MSRSSDSASTPTLERPAQTLREIVAKGAMPPLVLVVDDYRAACDRMRAHGVELTQLASESPGLGRVGEPIW